jgi:hypothetical protein
MARRDWGYINVNPKLIKLTEQAVEKITEFGIRKYENKQDYIKDALIRALIADGILQPEQRLEKEVTAK